MLCYFFFLHLFSLRSSLSCSFSISLLFFFFSYSFFLASFFSVFTFFFHYALLSPSSCAFSVFSPFFFSPVMFLLHCYPPLFLTPCFSPLFLSMFSLTIFYFHVFPVFFLLFSSLSFFSPCPKPFLTLHLPSSQPSSLHIPRSSSISPSP